jgi:hypothetical protein
LTPPVSYLFTKQQQPTTTGEVPCDHCPDKPAVLPAGATPTKAPDGWRPKDWQPSHDKRPCSGRAPNRAWQQRRLLAWQQRRLIINVCWRERQRRWQLPLQWQQQRWQWQQQQEWQQRQGQQRVTAAGGVKTENINIQSFQFIITQPTRRKKMHIISSSSSYTSLRGTSARAKAQQRARSPACFRLRSQPHAALPSVVVGSSNGVVQSDDDWSGKQFTAFSTGDAGLAFLASVLAEDLRPGDSLCLKGDAGEQETFA